MLNKKALIALLAAVVLSLPLVGLAAGEPENVTGLSAAAVSPTSISLTWNAAKDAQGDLVDHYRVYYGATSVQLAGQGNYETEVNTPNNNTTYLISGLTPGTLYYFSMTAFDKNSVESEAYSLEASASTPAEAGAPAAQPAPPADATPPTVTKAVSADKTHVTVEFSEAVKLPVALPEKAFQIAEQVSPENMLTVSAAVLNAADATGKTVTLTTAPQTAGISYQVTAGVAVTDLAGNPVSSGVTDSAVFTGSSAVAETVSPVITIPVEAAPAETTVKTSPAAPEAAVANDFDAKFFACEPAVSGEREVVGKSGTSCSVKIRLVKTDAAGAETQVEGACAVPLKTLSSAAQKTWNAIFTEDLNVYKQYCSGGEFMNEMKARLVDRTAPEDITAFTATYKKQVDAFVALLKWAASINSAKDLIDQILYQSLDRGVTYETGKALGPSVTSTEVSGLQGGKEYTFKITTKDDAGNESVGAIKSIRLPQTGVGVGLFLMLSAAAAHMGLKRKK